WSQTTEPRQQHTHARTNCAAECPISVFDTSNSWKRRKTRQCQREWETNWKAKPQQKLTKSEILEARGKHIGENLCLVGRASLHQLQQLQLPPAPSEQRNCERNNATKKRKKREEPCQAPPGVETVGCKRERSAG